MASRPLPRRPPTMRRRTDTTGSHGRAAVYQALIVDVANRLDAEAMRRAQRLDDLDLQGASACHQVARRARAVAKRFDTWNVPEQSTFDSRKLDLDEYFEVIRLARQLGVELIAG